jgi:hypothetical protein
MIIEGLMGAAGLLTIFDAALTRRRMYDYGVEVELNWFLKKCCKIFGIEVGLLVGQLVPVFALLSVLYFYNLTWMVAFLVGVKFKLFHNQLLSLIFEKQLIDALKASGKLGSDGDSTLQSPPSQSEEPSQSDPSSSKDDDGLSN